MRMINNYCPGPSLGSGLTPELLNDLIQEKPDNVGTALKRYLERNDPIIGSPTS